MPVWWTKRSLPPSSGVTKPKPLSSLNHLTVPVAIAFLLRMWTANAGDAVRRRLRALNTTCAEHDARRLTRTILPMCGGVRDRTVRKGSPVRVRQRALAKGAAASPVFAAAEVTGRETDVHETSTLASR